MRPSGWACRFSARVPLHMSIRVASDAGTPVVESEPEGDHAGIYRAIATRIKDGLQIRTSAA